MVHTYTVYKYVGEFVYPYLFSLVHLLLGSNFDMGCSQTLVWNALRHSITRPCDKSDGRTTNRLPPRLTDRVTEADRLAGKEAQTYYETLSPCIVPPRNQNNDRALISNYV